MLVTKVLVTCDFCGVYVEHPAPSSWMVKWFTQPTIGVHACENRTCQEGFAEKVSQMELVWIGPRGIK